MANNFGQQGRLGKTQLKKQLLAIAKEEQRKQLDEQIAKGKEEDKVAALAKKAEEVTARKEAREKSTSKFPDLFSRSSAEALVQRIDFAQADYVETTTSDGGTVTRRAFVHYVMHDRDTDESVNHDYDCWVGANIHPAKDGSGLWDPGNSYILEYPDFQVTTSGTAVTAISRLPASKGQKPAIL